MTFYFDDKQKAARLLFDAISDLSSTISDAESLDANALCIGFDLGKVCAAREYLAATLLMPVIAPEEAPVEPKRALEVVS